MSIIHEHSSRNIPGVSYIVFFCEDVAGEEYVDAVEMSRDETSPGEDTWSVWHAAVPRKKIPVVAESRETGNTEFDDKGCSTICGSFEEMASIIEDDFADGLEIKRRAGKFFGV